MCIRENASVIRLDAIRTIDADDGLLGDGGVVICPESGRDLDASRRVENASHRWRAFCS